MSIALAHIWSNISIYQRMNLTFFSTWPKSVVDSYLYPRTVHPRANYLCFVYTNNNYMEIENVIKRKHGQVKISLHWK